jgi:hypothetical protein
MSLSRALRPSTADPQIIGWGQKFQTRLDICEEQHPKKAKDKDGGNSVARAEWNRIPALTV